MPNGFCCGAGIGTSAGLLVVLFAAHVREFGIRGPDRILFVTAVVFDPRYRMTVTRVVDDAAHTSVEDRSEFLFEDFRPEKGFGWLLEIWTVFG